FPSSGFEPRSYGNIYPDKPDFIVDRQGNTTSPPNDSQNVRFEEPYQNGEIIYPETPLDFSTKMRINRLVEQRKINIEEIGSISEHLQKLSLLERMSF